MLDEHLGLTPRQRVSPRLREKAVALAVEMPYHRGVVAYEGKREVAKGRRELMGRRIAAGVSEGQEFWEQTVVQFGHT